MADITQINNRLRELQDAAVTAKKQAEANRNNPARRQSALDSLARIRAQANALVSLRENEIAAEEPQPETETGAGAGAGASSVADTSHQRSALASIRQILADYGLPDSLANWAWDQIIQGAPESEVVLGLRQRPEYRQIYGTVEDARRQAGLAPLTVQQIRGFTDAYRAEAARFGVKVGSNPADFAALFTQDIRPDEFGQRLALRDQVQRRGEHFRNTFASVAGIQTTPDDLFDLLTGLRPDLEKALGQVTGTPASLADIRAAFDRAASEEEALFRAGGRTVSGTSISERTAL